MAIPPGVEGKRLRNLSLVFLLILLGGHAVAELTADEKSAIRAYSEDDFVYVNETLRGQRAGTPDIVREIDLLTQALAKLPPVDGELHRSMNFFEGWERVFREGRVLTEKSFTSFTTKTGESSFGSGLSFRVQSKAGKDIAPYSRYPGEGEVLYPPGSRFRVKSVRAGKDNADIELEDLNIETK